MVPELFTMAVVVAIAIPLALVALIVAPLLKYLSALISWSGSLLPYAGGAIAFPFIMIFTHTFVFGHLARLDPTGRAVAATPAVLMSGSMIGPLLGGILVQNLGYPALGVAALAFDLVAIGFFAASYSQKERVVAAQFS